jgi:hypothetical protein
MSCLALNLEHGNFRCEAACKKALLNRRGRSFDRRLFVGEQQEDEMSSTTRFKVMKFDGTGNFPLWQCRESRIFFFGQRTI